MKITLRLLFVGLIGCICTFAAFSDVKDYVVIVKSNIHEKTKDTFKEVATYFEKLKESELAAIFTDFTKGYHGSGFIITDKNGNNYIITNNHVVAPAATVDIEIENPDGTHRQYANSTVLYTNDDLDLAVLEFPNREKVLKVGLPVGTGEGLSDGDEVWSAGFPGLAGKPAWQFAKGNITNKKAFIDEIIDKTLSYVIQHSATIDPGNSGGPLLVRDKVNPNDYRVVGINTWSVANRQNTFFALPAEHVNKVLDQAFEMQKLASDKKALKELLIKNCKTLAAELASEKPKVQKLARFISYEFVAEKGWESFINVLNSSSKEDRLDWQKSFFGYSPIETMRAAIYARFRYTLEKNKELSQIRFDSINFSDDDKFDTLDRIRTVFTIKETKKEITWKYAEGHWRIVDMTLDRIGADSIQSNGLKTIEVSGVGGVITLLPTFGLNFYGGALFDWNVNPLFRLSTGLQYGSIADNSSLDLASSAFLRIPLSANLVMYTEDIENKSYSLFSMGIGVVGNIFLSGSETSSLGFTFALRSELPIVPNTFHLGFCFNLDIFGGNNNDLYMPNMPIILPSVGIVASYLP